jgi:hypothetical protein
VAFYRSKAEICRRYGVSRKTGYKIAGRYELEGLPVSLTGAGLRMSIRTRWARRKRR